MLFRTRPGADWIGTSMAHGSNTIEQKVLSVQNAGKEHPWPNEAGDCTENCWNIYLKNQKSRAHDDWLAGDLFELARVSSVQALVVEEWDKYQDEGAITYGGKTGMVPTENPRGRAIGTMNSMISSSLRRLGITASNSGGDRTAKANRGSLEREAERGLQNDRRSLI